MEIARVAARDRGAVGPGEPRSGSPTTPPRSATPSLTLARSVPTQLSAVTLRLGEIQSDVAALAGSPAA